MDDKGFVNLSPEKLRGRGVLTVAPVTKFFDNQQVTRTDRGRRDDVSGLSCPETAISSVLNRAISPFLTRRRAKRPASVRHICLASPFADELARPFPSLFTVQPARCPMKKKKKKPNRAA